MTSLDVFMSLLTPNQHRYLVLEQLAIWVNLIVTLGLVVRRHNDQKHPQNKV